MRRLTRWLEGFAARHGDVAVQSCLEPPGWSLATADGNEAFLHAPPWLPGTRSHMTVADQQPSSGSAPDPGMRPAGQERPEPGERVLGFALDELPAQRPCFGVLLVRRAGYAVACFAGPDRLEAKVGRRHIHGRTAAGGWSQQRYARRRANQADEVAAAVAATADRIIATRPEVAFLVTGGDRPLLADVLRLADPRLRRLPIGAHLGIGTPDASVLAGVPDRVLSVRIDLREPPQP